MKDWEFFLIVGLVGLNLYITYEMAMGLQQASNEAKGLASTLTSANGIVGVLSGLFAPKVV